MATTVAAEPSKPAAKVTRAGWYALFLVSSAQGLSLLDRQILSILAPSIRADLHIGDSELGLLYGTLFSLFYALFSLPLGRLVDGWIRTRLLWICISAWSVFAGLSAFAGGYGLLAVSRLGVGVGEAAAQPSANSIIFDTFPRDQEASESQALDIALLAGLLPAFCGEKTLNLTLRGRMFSGDFAFRTPGRGLPVEVSRVQIEVDAGYEGEDGIYLVEAKRGRRDDFHIRQLWYPYLNWTARTRKRVVPIFFTYSNGQYLLSEFEFGDGSTAEAGPGGLVRVDPQTPRRVRNLSDSEEAVYLVVGGKGGYVGRDGHLAPGETHR